MARKRYSDEDVLKILREIDCVLYNALQTSPIKSEVGQLTE